MLEAQCLSNTFLSPHDFQFYIKVAFQMPKNLSRCLFVRNKHDDWQHYFFRGKAMACSSSKLLDWIVLAIFLKSLGGPIETSCAIHNGSINLVIERMNINPSRFQPSRLSVPVSTTWVSIFENTNMDIQFSWVNTSLFIWFRFSHFNLLCSPTLMYGN